MIFTALFFLKLIITMAMVMGLSFLAEKVSPRWAGIISGVPTGTAIVFLFYGLEQGPKFAAESAAFNIVGMLAFQVFLFGYFLMSRTKKIANIFASSFIAILGYFIISFILMKISFSLISALIVPFFSIPLFIWLFRKIEVNHVEERVSFKISTAIGRALLATGVILCITGVAGILGPKWAGLLSAFPTTVFPLLLIIHHAYGVRPVHIIIKHIPQGQWAMVLYVVSLSWSYPFFGVWVGTLVSYLLVMIYLGLFAFLSRRKIIQKIFK